jgi:predicted CXXCH cytochrome family protein
VKIQLVARSAQRAPVKRTVQAEWLRVGRNASCEIHLADPRVPLEHGMIVDRDGLVYLEGEGGSQNITRKSVRSIRLVPGEPLEVGPYHLTLQPAPPGFDASIAVELVRPLEAGEAMSSRTGRLTLGSIGLTRRWAAWVWGFTVLAVFLALPAARVLDLPWAGAAQRLGFSDRLWNPGPVLLAHQPIEQKCASCHEVAFEHVKDRACLQCHQSIGHHVGPALAPAALFDGARCATCHRDHKGAKPTHRDDDGLCVSCHRDLGSRVQGTHAANASDFARDHPAFRLSLPTESGVVRVRQDAPSLKEKSNLVFPHAPHLDTAGVRSPVQGRMKLECRSCHVPDATRRGFEPISMPKHCQECHALQFEPAVTTREVPHGNPAEAMTVIEEFYATLALRGVRDSFQKAFGVPGEGLLRRAGEPDAAERGGALRLASRKARQVGEEMFTVRVCVTCHAVARDAGTWRVAPIRANHQWMPHARFDHKSHAQTPCADCHDVARSKDATDVALPAIAKCRECHGGSAPAPEKVTSNCLLCHGFHDAKHPWDPSFRPRATDRAARGDAR